MMVHDPIGGADGTFALVGLGEKDCVELKFIARSGGGHAATPGRDTPLVRLGKFMAAVEASDIFKADIAPALCEMFSRFGATMKQPLKGVLSHPRLFKDSIAKTIPAVSDTAGAMLKTTIAFTMAQGSGGVNVLPQEAWVIGDMRCSHHQGKEASIRAITKAAEKFGVETEVLASGAESRLSDYNGTAFRLVEEAVRATIPGEPACAPYIMNGASDSKYFDRVCDQCIRFLPFTVKRDQLGTVHGVNECLDLGTLVPAVNYYRYMMQHV
jgi:carboxypeptidase PM20D1